MHLNSISYITQQVTGEECPHPIPEGPWVARAEKKLRRSLTPEDRESIAAIGRILWSAYRTGKEEGKRPEARFIIHDPDMCHTQDLARLTLLPDKTNGQLAEMLGFAERTIRNSKASVEAWFDTQLLFLHHQSYYAMWWLPTKVGKKVWVQLQTIVTMCSEL